MQAANDIFEQARIAEVLAEVSALRESGFTQVVHSGDSVHLPGSHGCRPRPSRESPPGQGSEGIGLARGYGPNCGHTGTALWTPQGAGARQQPSISFPPGVVGVAGSGDASSLFGAFGQAGDAELQQREVVIGENGQPRQAGADVREGEYIKRYKRRAEESLFIFLKGVLGRNFLTPHFHKEICAWIQQCPPFRKLVLMPREHAKTTIVAGGLPPHILIQSAATNIYFPGLDGSECRILLCGETEKMARKNLRVVESIFEENKLFRAFWPERVWPGRAKSMAKAWSGEEMIIPRQNEWPDPTIRAIGVDGAITGSRPNVLIKDDLISLKAANSPIVMEDAIEWHKASRALLDKYEIESGLTSLEFIIGTRWAVYDLYSTIIDDDPSVELNDEKFHRIVRDGKILWPEKYTMEDIDQLRSEHGANFYLLYLNSAADPELTDFDMELVRSFAIVNGMIVFEEDERDAILRKRLKKKQERGEYGASPPKAERGMPLNEWLRKRFEQAAGGGSEWGVRVRLM